MAAVPSARKNILGIDPGATTGVVELDLETGEVLYAYDAEPDDLYTFLSMTSTIPGTAFVLETFTLRPNSHAQLDTLGICAVIRYILERNRAPLLEVRPSDHKLLKLTPPKGSGIKGPHMRDAYSVAEYARRLHREKLEDMLGQD
jgi:hypothetical protein